MRRRPWWALRPADDDEPDTGTPGPGKVRVPVAFDVDGSPDWDTAIWCEPDAADQWDARRWRSRP
jgi:hypothetical protein